MKEHKTRISSFQRTMLSTILLLSLVTMTQWTHLFPSRTEKLSTVVAKVAKARIARCWALFSW